MSYKALQDTKTVSAGGGEDEDEDWETDPDFVNTMTEEQQRWGGARDTGTIDMDAFRRDVQQEDAAEQKKKARNVCAHTFEKDSPKDTGR